MNICHKTITLFSTISFAVLLSFICVSRTSVSAAGPIFYWEQPETPPADLNYPSGLVFDSQGNLYICDSNSDETSTRINKYNSSLEFQTNWETGRAPWATSYPFCYLAVDSDDNVYITDGNGGGGVLKYGSDGTFITSWTVGQAWGIEINESDQVFVTESGYDVVRKYDSNGNFLQEFTEGTVSCPYEIDIDSAGNIYFAADSNYIYKFNPDGTFNTKWSRSDVFGLDFDGSDNIYTESAFDGTIYKFTPTGTLIATYTKQVGIAPNQFDVHPGQLVIHQNSIYIADRGNHRIQKFALDGAYEDVFGKAGSSNGQFSFPYDLVADSEGNIYVADSGNSRVQKFTSEGTFLGAWGTNGTDEGQFISPKGIGIDGNNNIYVADSDNISFSIARVQKFNNSGTFLLQWGSVGNGDGQFCLPYDVLSFGSDIYALDACPRNYGAFGFHARIQSFSPEGVFQNTWGQTGTDDGQFREPEKFASDSLGNIYVVDTINYRIQKFSSDGTFITKWGSNGLENGEFSAPKGIAVDADGYIWVADTGNNRIQKFDSNGNFITTFGSEGTGPYQFNSPHGLSFMSDGTLLVADTGNHRVISYVFDTQSPSIELEEEEVLIDDKVMIKGTATEQYGVVVSVEFQLDGTSGDWLTCTADDGAFDEAVEDFTCTIEEPLSCGEHRVYIRSTDSFGNETVSTEYITIEFEVGEEIEIDEIHELPETGSNIFLFLSIGIQTFAVFYVLNHKIFYRTKQIIN